MRSLRKYLYAKPTGLSGCSVLFYSPDIRTDYVYRIELKDNEPSFEYVARQYIQNFARSCGTIGALGGLHTEYMEDEHMTYRLYVVTHGKFAYMQCAVWLIWHKD